MSADEAKLTPANASAPPASSVATTPAISPTKLAIIDQIIDAIGPAKEAQQLRDANFKIIAAQLQFETGLMKGVEKLAAAQTKSKDAATAKKLNADLDKDLGATFNKTAARQKELFPKYFQDTDSFVADALRKVYDQNYSEDELKDILAFYKSQTGTKFLQVQPQLNKQYSELKEQYSLKKWKALNAQLKTEGL